MQDDDENWLHAGFVNCPRCLARLYRVDHSPMSDDYCLYCELCARSVEVGFYDPVFQQIATAEQARGDKSYLTLMSSIEERLRPCDCGGHFKHDAVRRCYVCQYPVLRGASGVDLWPDIGCPFLDDRDPTPEEIAFYDRFQAEYIRKDNIWK